MASTAGTGCGERAAAGSFEAFYVAYAAHALRVAYALTHDRVQAEDAAAEAFANIYRRWGLVEISKPRAYVRRAVANTAVSGFRRRERQRAALRRATVPAAHDDAERVCDETTVTALVATLPPRQRDAVTLRYLQDLSEAEVARRMGTSVGAVKSSTSRGVAALRRAVAAVEAAGTPPADSAQLARAAGWRPPARPTPATRRTATQTTAGVA